MFVNGGSRRTKAAGRKFAPKSSKMARIGFSPEGWGTEDDPASFLCNHFDPLSGFAGFFTLDFDTAFAFVRRYKQLKLTVAITYHDTVLGDSSITGDQTFPPGWTYSIADPSERNIRCAAPVDFNYSFNIGASPNFIATIRLGYYDSTNDNFIFGVLGRMDTLTVSEAINFGIPGGTPSGVTCTILGQNVPMYTGGDPANSSSGTITLELPPTLGWWEYDNGLPGGPPNGPIFDENDGTQLITPLPVDVGP